MALIEEYDSVWPSWFGQVKARIEEQLQGIPHTIEHVGSTAVPGMAAKPIIDIDVVIEHGALPAIIGRLGNIGYLHRGDLGISGREAFDLADLAAGQLPPHHLYVCERDNNALQEHLAFRDFMRLHPEWCQRLSDLKRQLCGESGNDRQAYIDGKSSLVREITRLAVAERKE